MSTETAYDRIRKQRCEWCANWNALIPEGEPYGGWHIADAPHSYRQPCTAPTKDAVIESLAEENQRMREALENAPHDEDCHYIVSLLRYDSATGRKLPTAPCNCWKRAALASDTQEPKP